MTLRERYEAITSTFGAILGTIIYFALFLFGCVLVIGIWVILFRAAGSLL